MDVRKHLISTDEQLRKAWEFIKAGDEPIGLDFETSGPNVKWRGKPRPDPYRHKITGFSLSRGNLAVYIPVRHNDGPNVSEQLVREILSALIAMAVNGRRVWVHNLAYELNILINEGLWEPHVDMPVGMLDSQVAVWLAFTKRGKEVGLKTAAGWLLGLQGLPSFDNVANGRQACEVPPAEMADYAAMDAWLTVAVGEKAYDRLESEDLVQHFHDMDMPLVEITRGMARGGMARDRAELELLRDQWAIKRDAAREEFRKLTTTKVMVPVKVRRALPGEFFKNGKPKMKTFTELQEQELGADVKNDIQVAKWLYDYLGWWPVPEHYDRRIGEYVKDERNDRGVYSTKAEHVRKFTGLAGDAGKAAKLRLEFQKYSKLIGTYLDVLIELPDQYGDDRIHPSLSITGTTTQRFSGSGPNFQNIPSRSAEGAAIRRALLAPYPNWVLVVRDYSAVEIRLQADMANDTMWMEGYRLEADFGIKYDLHQQMADELTKLFGKPIPRALGKLVNLSVQYGVSPETLAIHISNDPAVVKAGILVTREQASSIIDLFYELHPKIARYQDQAERFAMKNGYIPTKDGFKRFGFKKKWLPKEQRMGLSPGDRRKAANTPVQGWSAGIMKASMVDLWRKWTGEGIYGKRVLLVMSVHDEIVSACPPDWAERVGKDMDDIMVKPRWGIRVPLVVEGGRGTSWADSK